MSRLPGTAMIVGLIAFIGLSVWAFQTVHESPANRLSEVDRATLLRTDAQIQLIQMKYQREAEPIAKEQQAIIERVCAAAHLPVLDCQVDPTQGTVLRKPPAPAKK